MRVIEPKWLAKALLIDTWRWEFEPSSFNAKSWNSKSLPRPGSHSINSSRGLTGWSHSPCHKAVLYLLVMHVGPQGGSFPWSKGNLARASVSAWRRGWMLLRLPHTPLFCALMFLILGHADPPAAARGVLTSSTEQLLLCWRCFLLKLVWVKPVVSYLNPPQKESLLVHKAKAKCTGTCFK